MSPPKGLGARPFFILLQGVCGRAAPCVNSNVMSAAAMRLLDEVLRRNAPAVHLVLEAPHRRAAQVPRQPGARGTTADDLVGEERVEILHRVDLARRGVAPAPAQEAEPPLHLAQNEGGLLAHRLRARLAMANGAFPV